MDDRDDMTSLEAIAQGMRFRDARDRLQMTQSMLATASGVGERTIGRVEKGHPPSKEVLRSLCAVLGMDAVQEGERYAQIRTRTAQVDHVFEARVDLPIDQASGFPAAPASVGRIPRTSSEENGRASAAMFMASMAAVCVWAVWRLMSYLHGDVPFAVFSSINSMVSSWTLLLPCLMGLFLYLARMKEDGGWTALVRALSFMGAGICVVTIHSAMSAFGFLSTASVIPHGPAGMTTIGEIMRQQGTQVLVMTSLVSQAVMGLYLTFHAQTVVDRLAQAVANARTRMTIDDGAVG